MNHLEQAKHNYRASVDGGNFELDAQGETPRYIHMSDAAVNALIALAEEQRNVRAGTIAVAAALITIVERLDILIENQQAAQADVLDNFTEHERNTKECIACAGTGYYDDDGSPPCGACNGTGVTNG